MSRPRSRVRLSGPLRAAVGLCCRARPDAGQQELLRAAVGKIEWSAEAVEWIGAEGLGPLVRMHLQAIGEELPTEVSRVLSGLTVRARRQAAIRNAALVEIVALLESAGVETLVLKGAALANLVYPEPSLRTMSDLDLLVAPGNARRAEQILSGAGFTALHPEITPDEHFHLPGLTRSFQDMSITVELHHALGLVDPVTRERLGHQSFDRLAATAQPFPVGESTMRTLGPEDLLRHVLRHGFCGTLRVPSFRLSQIADVVSIVEAWGERMDWDRLIDVDRHVVEAVALLHWITPLSLRARRSLPIAPDRRPLGAGWCFYDHEAFGVGTPERLAYWLAAMVVSPWYLRVRYAAHGPLGDLARLRGHWRNLSQHRAWVGSAYRPPAGRWPLGTGES